MARRKRWWIGAALATCVLAAASAGAQETVTVDAQAQGAPFPHFWEQMFGSGRAILSLRESYREDLRAVKKVADFRYVRFHAILDDEVGVYNLDEHCNPVYNFAYVDQIYDGLLKNGVKPFVEISFMPKKLAFNPDALHPFWYKQNVSPPKSMALWDDLMKHFAQHLVDRYGIDELSKQEDGARQKKKMPGRLLTCRPSPAWGRPRPGVAKWALVDDAHAVRQIVRPGPEHHVAAPPRRPRRNSER